MQAMPTALPGVLLLEPRVFGDDRGHFFESYNARVFSAAVGREVVFVQDNQSRSVRGVLRGLHYQVRQPQGKLVRVLAGEIFDVVVDLRRSASTFGRWAGFRLSAANRHQLWIPEGYAHGFLAVSEEAEVLYKTTDFYAPADERCVAWNDPAIGIEWPLTGVPTLSPKDASAPRLAEAETFA